MNPDFVLMLLADARLPTSAHTQSGGLEPALNGGLDPQDIPSYCRTRLETVTRVEAATAAVARYVAGPTPDTGSSTMGGAASLDAVEAAWAARTPSDAIRTASYDLGRAYRRLALRLWPADRAVQLLGERPAVSRAVALGVVAVATGLDAERLVRLVGYDDVQTVVAAALKLTPFDPVVATQWVLALSADIERLVPLAGLTRPEDIPAPSAPLIEAWAQAHAQTTRRLFRA